MINLTYRYTDLIMGFREYNIKHYYIYYNICRYLNGNHIYCFLQSPINFVFSLGPKQKYLACNFSLQSHKDDYETAVYHCNYANLYFNQSMGIKDFTFFWNLPSIK